MGELEEDGIKKIAIACAMVAGMVSCKNLKQNMYTNILIKPNKV